MGLARGIRDIPYAHAQMVAQVKSLFAAAIELEQDALGLKLNLVI